MKNSPDRIGLGTYKLQDEECVLMVKNAIEKGYRTIDTAVLYKNHESIASGIKESGIDVKELYISSKIGKQSQINGKIRETLIEILSELKIKSINQILLHEPVVSNLLSNWRILEECQKEGLVLNIGVSNFRVPELKYLLENCRIRPYINQFEVHPYCTRQELVSYCLRERILIQAYSSLVVGRKFSDMKLKTLSDSSEIPMYKLLLGWGLGKNFYVIPKPLTITELMQNIELLKEEPLDSKLIQNLDTFNENYYTIYKHRDQKVLKIPQPSTDC